MLALIEMNLLPGGKRGATRPKKRRGGGMPGVPKVAGLREMVRGDPWVILVVLLGAGAIAHLALTFFSQSVTLGNLGDEIEVQRQDSIRYAAAIAAADSLQARRDTLLQKVQIIREIDQDRFVWPHIMDDVSRVLPEYTWLTTVQHSTGGGTDLEFRIEGMTGLTQALTRFMRDLEDSPFIRGVRLVSQERQQQGARLVHNFVLTARYQMPDSSVIVTEPIILTGE